MTRTRLLLGTALAAALLGTPAAAQFPFVTDVAVTTGGGLPTTTDIGDTRIITLNAARTYFDHGQGFFLPGGTTLRFNFANPGRGGVALLRSDFGITVLGTVEGRLGPTGSDPLGGNLWFFSRGGLIVSEGGRIAAGGVLLSNALPDLLTTPAGRAQLLADNRLEIEANLGPLLTTGALILSGGRVEASDGFLAIIAQSVSQEAGTDLRASRGTLLVGAANRYTIRLARNPSNDFDLVEFEVPAGGGTQTGGVPIDLAGSLRGGNVWLSLVGSSSVTSAIVRATGTVVATAATLDQGQIVLSAGSGIAASEPGPPQDLAPTRIRAELADLAADGDIRLRLDEGEIQTMAAGRDIAVETRTIVVPGLTALGSVEAGGSLRVAVGGDLLGFGSFTVGGDLIVRAAETVTLGSLSAGDDIVAIAGGLLTVGSFGDTIESRNAGADVTRDSNETDPSGPVPPIRSLYLQSDKDRVLLTGLVSGFTQGAIFSSAAPQIDIDTGAAPVFLDRGLSVETADRLATTRITLTDSFGGPGPAIRFSEIASGPLRLRATGSVAIGQLTAVGFAGIEAGADVSLGEGRVAAERGNPGSLALASDGGTVSLGGADVDGDLILVARQGSVSSLVGASLRFGDDLYAISERESLGRGVNFNAGTSLVSKAGFADVAGNEILDNGDPALLLRDFDRDTPGNGRLAELLALAQYPQFPPGVSGSVRFEGTVANLDRLLLLSESASIGFRSPGSQLGNVSATAGLDLEFAAGAASALVFNAGRDATLELDGPDPVLLSQSSAGRDLSVEVAGPLALLGVAVGRDATLTGASLDISGLVGALRNARFTTTVAPLAVDSLDVSGLLELNSADSLTATGPLTAGGDIRLRARDDTPAGVAELGTVSAGGNLDLRAWTVRASSLVAGGSARVQGTGPGSIEATEIVADDDVDLDSPSIEVGFVRSTGLGPDAAGDGFNVRLAGGAGTFVALEAPTDIRARFTGALAVADALAGRDADLAGGSLRISARQAGLFAGRDARLASASTLEADRVSAGDDVTVQALGTATLGTLRSRGDGPDQEGDGANIRITAAGADALALEAPADILVDATSGPATLGRAGGVLAGRDLIVAGTTLDVVQTSAGRDLRLSATAGDIVGPAFAAVRDLQLAASGRIETGEAAAGRDLALAAGGALEITVAASAGRDARLSGGSVTGQAGSALDVWAGRDVSLESSAGAVRARATAGDDIRVRAGGDLDLAATTTGAGQDAEGDGSRIVAEATGRAQMGPTTAAGNLDVTAGGPVIGNGTPTAGGSLRMAGAEIRLPQGATAGTDVRLAATGGSVLAGGPIQAGRDIDLSARDAINFDRLSAGDDVRLVSATTLVVGNEVRTTGLGPDDEGDGSVLDVRGGSIALGTVSAAGDFAATSGGAVSVTAITTARDARVTALSLALGGGGSIGRDLLITATGAGFTAPGPLAAGRDIRVAGAGDVRLAALAAGRDVGLAAAGTLETGTISAPGSLSAQAARLTIAGASIGGSASLETSAGELALPGSFASGGDLRLRAPETAGGILRLGRLRAGGLLDARAFSILAAPGGGLVSARGPVRMAGTGAQTIDLAEVISDDDVDLSSPVIRVGLVRSTGLGPDRAGDGFNIRLDGGTGTFGTLEAPTDILARFTGSLSTGGASAGRDLLLSGDGGPLSIGSATAGGVATLAGASFQLGQTLAARELRFVSAGPMRIGGAAGGAGFVVAEADLARITAPGGIAASTGAVPRATTPQGPASAAFEAAYGLGGNADLVIDRFAFDPSAIPVWGFYAGAAAQIRIIGDVTPTTPGGRMVLGANPVAGLTPGAVLVGASLGAGQLLLSNCYVALLPLANIAITALGDVIFGEPAFQAAVAAANPNAIDVQAGTPGLPPSPANDRLWAVAETLSISAPGRIVSQNSSARPGGFVGLVVANRQAGAPLPTVLTVNGGSVVDLSGVLVNGQGRAFFGPTAARSGAVVASNPAARFNACAINGPGSCLPPLAGQDLGFRIEQFVPPNPIPRETDRLTGEIPFLFADQGRLSVGIEAGALFIRRDEEEERPARPPTGG